MKPRTPACILFPGAMPKGDTWPGGVAAEPSSNMDSAGSYDSVISTNSGYVSSDPLTSVPLTLLLYSWPYKTQTGDAHRPAQWAVTAWTRRLKCGSKGDLFDVCTITEHKPKSSKSK